MSSLLRWLSPLVLVGAELTILAQQPANSPSATLTNQDDGGPPPRASFRSVPSNVPYYPTNVYAPYNGAVGGYLSGAADVIDAQGQFMVSNQQALLMREQVLENRQDTRRKTLDEWLYERANTPTQEDEAERRRLERLRASRNNPDPTEIWSGKALNRLLDGIQRQLAQGVRGPDVPISPQILKRINVSGGKAQGSLALLRDDGRLRWPDALASSDFDADRQKADQLTAQVYQQLQGGNVSSRTVRDLGKAVDTLTVNLRRGVSDLDVNDYTQAKSYLNELDSMVKVLKEPQAANSAQWSLKGNNVAEIAQQMTRDGLKFAPAVPGDEASYTAMHQALVSYVVLPAQGSWDPFAK